MVAEAKSKVDNMNNQIAEQWKGQAFQSYLQQFNELAGHVQEFNNLLESINTQLNKYATTIEERDRQDAGAFGLN
jgi:WXG100 family type VII secretion target